MIEVVAKKSRDWLAVLVGAGLVGADQVSALAPIVDKYGLGALAVLALLELRGIRQVVAGHERRITTLEGETDASRRRRRVGRGSRQSR